MLDAVQMPGRHQVHIDRSRDVLLTDFGRATLSDRYLMPGEEFQDLFARVASYYGDDAGHAQRIYDYMSKLWFMPATPVLSNGGTQRGLPISCFLNEASDSLEGIVGLWNENVWLASKGGGIGSYWGNLRSIGEKVGAVGKTSGVIPFIRVMDSLTLAISQGSLRRGSAAVYLPVSHPEIEEFVEIRRPTGGDPNRKALNLHHGILVSDAFMRAVEADEQWALLSPKDETPVRSISARALWVRILTARIETGEPYLIFSDHVNRARPEHHKLAGLEVKTSNLCSEITLPTGRDQHGMERTAVCCLCSLNLESWFEWQDHPTFIEDIMRFLDNVLQDFIDRAPPGMEKARYSAMRERSRGAGRDGVPLVPAVAERAVGERDREGVEQADVQAHPRAGGPRLARAGRGARAVPGRRGIRHHGAVLAQDVDRADRVDFHHRGQFVAGDRADRGERVPAEDAVGQLHRAQPASADAAGGEGDGQRRGVVVDHADQGQRAASGFPDRAGEGGLQDRVRAGSALDHRARGGPRAVHLPEPVGQRLPRPRTCTSGTCIRSISWRGSAA